MSALTAANLSAAEMSSSPSARTNRRASGFNSSSTAIATPAPAATARGPVTHSAPASAVTTSAISVVSPKSPLAAVVR